MLITVNDIKIMRTMFNQNQSSGKDGEGEGVPEQYILEQPNESPGSWKWRVLEEDLAAKNQIHW